MHASSACLIFPGEFTFIRRAYDASSHPSFTVDQTFFNHEQRQRQRPKLPKLMRHGLETPTGGASFESSMGVQHAAQYRSSKADQPL